MSAPLPTDGEFVCEDHAKPYEAGVRYVAVFDESARFGKCHCGKPLVQFQLENK
jgi:hypothetical protein